MGIRGELFSTKVSLQNRTYFFNVKENRLGDLYLNIVESKNRDEGGFERQSVILFADDLQEFLQGFEESLKVLEKEVREKRKGKKPAESKPREKRADRENRSDNADGFGQEGARPKRVYKRDSDDSFQKRDSNRDFNRDSSRRDGPREGRLQGRRSDAPFRGADKPRGTFKSKGPKEPSRDAPKPRKRIVVKKEK